MLLRQNQCMPLRKIFSVELSQYNVNPLSASIVQQMKLFVTEWSSSCRPARRTGKVGIIRGVAAEVKAPLIVGSVIVKVNFLSYRYRADKITIFGMRGLWGHIWGQN